MNQEQINSIVGAVVQAVVQTLVEQITPIVVEEVKKEVQASMGGVLAMETEALAAPVLRLLQLNTAIIDEIDERIGEAIAIQKRNTEDSHESLARRVYNLEMEHVSIHSDEFKLAVRAALKEII